MRRSGAIKFLYADRFAVFCLLSDNSTQTIGFGPPHADEGRTRQRRRFYAPPIEVFGSLLPKASAGHRCPLYWSGGARLNVGQEAYGTTA